MAWRNVPDELCVKVLVHLKLHTLRLLKTVDYRTANLCRRVIRRREWQRLGNNHYDLVEELSDSLDQLCFPLTVSILEDRFKNPKHPQNPYTRSADTIGRGPPLLAKIHKINLLCICEGYRAAPDFEDTKDTDKLHRIVDLCVEVPGIGIVSSESGLRMLLENIVRERGVRLFPMPKNTYIRKSLSKLISGWQYDYDSDGQFTGMHSNDSTNTMSALELLDSMMIVTEISHNEFAGHAGPYSECGWMLSVKDLMRMSVGPFSVNTTHACAPPCRIPII